MLKWLLDKQPDVNSKDQKGWAALHFAVQNHRLDMIEELLNAGAKIDIKDSYGNTPLWRATFESRGRGEVTKLLLSHGADANRKNNSEISPLDLANSIANFDVKKYFNN